MKAGNFWWFERMERFFDYRDMYMQAAMFYPDSEIEEFQGIAEQLKAIEWGIGWVTK